MPNEIKGNTLKPRKTSKIEFMISPISPQQARKYRNGIDKLRRKSRKSLAETLESIRSAYLHPPDKIEKPKQNSAVERIGKNWRIVQTRKEQLAIILQYYKLYDGKE